MGHILANTTNLHRFSVKIYSIKMCHIHMKKVLCVAGFALFVFPHQGIKWRQIKPVIHEMK